TVMNRSCSGVLQIFQFHGAMVSTVRDAHPSAYPRRCVTIPTLSQEYPHMGNVGFNPSIASMGCGGGMAAAGPLPKGVDAFGGGGFDDMFTTAATVPATGGFVDAFGGERFVGSQMGGVIVGKDGEPAGRIPQGSFVDTKTGKIYGPDSKPITLPEG